MMELIFAVPGGVGLGAWDTLVAQAGGVVRDDTTVKLVVGLVMFAVAGGVGLCLVPLVLGALVRTTRAQPEKAAPYECGEPAIGQSWVQFDLRFYVVALVFIIFDVEIALFWPWAVVFGTKVSERFSAEAVASMKSVAVIDMLFFFGVIAVGFLYLWRYGYLDWVRAATGQRRSSSPGPSLSGTAKADV